MVSHMDNYSCDLLKGYFQRGQVRFVGDNFEIWNRFSIDFAIEIIILECKNLKIFACGALSDVISVDN